MPAGGPPRVRLGAGDDASGMASMLAELLADNLRDDRGRARAARLAHGPVVMTASDHDRSVTVRFAGREITVDEGADEDAPHMVGAWLDLAQLCSGRLSPVQAVRERRLTLRHVRRPDLLAVAGYVLSVPAGYYGDSPRFSRRRATTTALVVTAAAAAVVLLSTRRRRQRSPA